MLLAHSEPKLLPKNMWELFRGTPSIRSALIVKISDYRCILYGTFVLELELELEFTIMPLWASQYKTVIKM